MGKWNHRSRFQRRRSPMRWYSDRHHSNSNGYYSVDDGIPIWEKRFCEVIGSVPWQKIVEATSFKSWYKGNVITWDDSACQETFHNEKKRFWSNANGLYCDVIKPDPDVFISEVDWNTYIDPELVKDLETVYFAPPEEVKSSSCGNPWEVPVEEERRMLNVPWEGSDRFNVIGKKSNGWELSESSSGHVKDKVRPWEANLEKRDDMTSRDCLSNQWDKSEHCNKKVKGCEMIDNPWEAKPSCGNVAANDAPWGGNGWEDRGRDNDCWGNGGWGNREQKGYNQRNVGFVNDNVACRDSGVNGGGWLRRGVSETNQRNWDVKRSNDGWGRRSNERDGSCGYRTNYKYSRGKRDDHYNRKGQFLS